MKIIKNILKTRAGKVALSAMQTLGIATGVAIAGVGGYFALTSSQDVNPDTAFSSYDDGDVVYVAGHSAAGGYAGVVAPVEGGEIKSGFQAKLSHSLRMMNEETNKPELLEVEEQEQNVSAYSMDGASSGLGVGAGQQGANEAGLSMGGDMSAIQAQIAALQANAQAQQQQAAAAAAAAGQQAGDAVAAAQAALNGGAGAGKFGKPSGMATANGSNLGGEGLQPGSYQTTANAKPKEGQTIQSALKPTPTRAALFAGGRPDINAGRGAGAMDVNTLTAMTKQSAAIATKGGHAVDVFMAGESGPGISFTGGTVNTGAGSSSDFTGDNQVGALAGLVSNLKDESQQYEEARKELRKKVSGFAGKCIASSLTSVLGYIWTSKARKNLKKEIQKFKDEWGKKAFQGFGGARYDKFWYWHKAEVVVDAVYWAQAGGPLDVLTVWGVTSIFAWGKDSIDEDDFPAEEDAFIPTNPYGDPSTRSAGSLDIGCSYGVGSR